MVLCGNGDQRSVAGRQNSIYVSDPSKKREKPAFISFNFTVVVNNILIRAIGEKMSLEFNLPPDLTDLRQKARETFNSVNDKYSHLSANTRQKEAFNDTWQGLVDLNYTGFLIPQSFGGSDKGLLASTIVMEELASHGLHSFLPVLHAMTSVALVKFGSEAMKSDMLPQLASGKIKTAIAATEKEAGFNIFNYRTFAKLDGNDYVVNGTKIYISAADVGDYALLICRTTTLDECLEQGLPKTFGLTAFLLDLKAEGLEVIPVPSRGEGVMKQAEIKITNVRIASTGVIGESNKGTKVIFSCFNPERTLTAAMALGIGRYCLEKACEYAKERRVFGDTPIGAYQAIQHPLADVSIKLEASRLMTYKAARLFDAGAGLAEQAEGANAAKYLASKIAVRAVDTAIDTFGGKGFDEDYGIIHLLEEARLLITAPISNALILNQTAEHTLDLPRSY